MIERGIGDELYVDRKGPLPVIRARQVGGNIHKPQVRLDTVRVGFNLTYMTYSAFVPMVDIANYSNLLGRDVTINSYKAQIEIIANIIDEANAYAEKHFSPEILRTFYASRHAVSGR